MGHPPRHPSQVGKCCEQSLIFSGKWQVAVRIAVRPRLFYENGVQGVERGVPCRIAISEADHLIKEF